MTFTSLISCVKEHDISPKEHDISPKLRPEHLLIDTSLNYSFSGKIDKTVYASLWGSSLTDYKIDLNNDSMDDIKFLCSVYHHTIYDQWTASISTLNNNVEIDIVQQSVSYAKYFKRYYDSSTNDSLTVYYEENYSKTTQYPSNLSITTKIEDYPVIHSLGDTLNAHCNWNSGTYVLKYDDHSWGVQTNIQTGIWRDIDRKFIGIRFSEKDYMYYGWIALGVKGYYITLYKYACSME